MPIIKSVGAAGLFLVVGLSVGLTVLRIGQTVVYLTAGDAADLESTYSWLGADRPSHWDLHQRKTPPVALTLSDSSHYALNNTPLSSPNSSADSQYSSLLSNAEWSNTALVPTHTGHLRLGPHHRVFALTLSHQMHCVKMLQRALLPWGTDGDGEEVEKEAVPHHVRHCFDYLRQTLLCGAAGTVERGDFIKEAGRWFGSGVQGEGEEERRLWRGDTLVCEDWGRAYEALDVNLREWENWRDLWN